MKRQAAFSLVEVALALGVAAFCLIAVFGLLPVGLSINKEAIEQAAAMNLSAALIADVRSTPASQSSSTQFGIPLPSTTGGTAEVKQVALYLNEAGQEVGSAPDARYLVLVTLTGAAPNRLDSVFTHVLMTWPAQANAGFSTNAVTLDPTNASDPNDARTKLKNVAGSVETTAALSRN